MVPYFIILEVACGLNSNLISFLRLLNASALLEDSSSDIHTASEAGKIMERDRGNEVLTCRLSKVEINFLLAFGNAMI